MSPKKLRSKSEIIRGSETKVRKALTNINNNKLDPASNECAPHAMKNKRRSTETNEHNERVKQPRSEDKNGVTSVVQQYQKLSYALGANYGNTQKRLQLDFTPKCCMNMLFCHSNHSKKCPRPNIADSYQSMKAKHFMMQNRPLHFLKFTEDIGIRTEFPGEDILSYILELILLIKPKMYATYTAKHVLQESIVVFDNILTKFPPCWHDLKESYKNVLLTPVNKEKFLSSENIFEFVITKIQKTMLEENSMTKQPQNNQHDDDSKDDDDDITNGDFFNFYHWQAKFCPKESLDNHSRSEKLDRLFIVLHLLTKILELDLSIWMLRYMTKTSQHMFGDERPLVASLFFKDIYSQKSELSKKVISTFVDCCRLKFPKDKTEIISRVLALYSNTINLCEKNNMDKIIYPFVGNLTRELPMEIHRAIASTIRIDSSRSKWILSNISIFISVINELRIPFIKFIFIDELICKINFEFTGEKSTAREAINTPITVKKILENLTTNVWIQFVAQSPVSPVCTEEPSCSKYPEDIPHSVGETKNTTISRETYLHLLLECLKSYCCYHQIKDAVSIFMDREEKNLNAKVPRCCSVKKFNLALMEKDIQFLEKSLNFKQKRRLPILVRPIFDGIHVDDSVMLRYRTDIKYLMILQKQLRSLNEEHDGIFNDWTIFVNDIFQKA